MPPGGLLHPGSRPTPIIHAMARVPLARIGDDRSKLAPHPANYAMNRDQPRGFNGKVFAEFADCNAYIFRISGYRNIRGILIHFSKKIGFFAAS